MKWYTYLICIILIVAGTFCGIRFFQDVKAKSYVNGSIDISNSFSQECFNYSSTSVIFYHDIYNDDDLYVFDIDLLKSDDFNGLEKTYHMKLNEFILLDAVYNFRSIFAVFNVEFYDTDFSLKYTSALNISIKFLSNKTQLTLSTTGEESARYLEQYFNDYGITLKVVEIY